ncbi:MAG: RluA family pseudouridine synthase [Clostridia bacterium]|nr:RluA family pseudouridine synthase [Clostridia bacterium]
MEKRTFKAENNIRADLGVAEYFGDLSRSYVKKLLEGGAVSVNGKAAKPNTKLKAGDIVEIELPEPETLEAKPQDIPLDIVYEDDFLLVINKPADMVVHPAAGNYENTLVNALLYHCGDNLSTINGVIRPGIVHRLDKDTTGLLVVAKGDRAHVSLSEQLKTRELKRHYFALVHSNIKEDEGTIDKRLNRSSQDRKKIAVVKEGGREAKTHYKVLERFGKYTFVECVLDTGRTHQIRVHMKSIGHPVVGDKTYGVKGEEFNLPGQLLHAGKIGFIHPESGEYMEFSAPLPETFERILSVLRQRQVNLY